MKELAFGITRGVSLQTCRGAAEAKTSAHGLKRSALRLEVVELRVEIIGAEPERVRAPEPREVRGGDVLVVAEQERIAGVVVADVGPTAVDLKRGHAALQVIWTIGAGDVQDV